MARSEVNSHHLADTAGSAVRDPRLVADKTSFPLPFSERIPAVPITPFVGYYPTYAELADHQKMAYLYIRQEFVNGYAVPDAPLSYLFICAYEIGARARTLKSFAVQLNALRTIYAHETKLRRYLSGWILDARLADAIFTWDEITREAIENRNGPISLVDACLLAGELPPSRAFLQYPRYRHLIESPRRSRLERAIDFLRTTLPEDPIVDAVRSTTTGAIDVSLFPSYPQWLRLPRFLPHASRRITLPTYLRPGSPLIWALDDLIADACDVIGEPVPRFSAEAHDDHQASYDADDEGFVSVAGTQTTVSIVRENVPTRMGDALPTIASVDDLIRAIGALWDGEMRFLMAIVIWLCEAKPYVEGLITFSRDLRETYDRAAAALNADLGLPPYRRAFFALGQGRMAPWMFAHTTAAVRDMKMGTTQARFIKSLQHELRGSAARAQVLSVLLREIARDTNRTPHEVALAFENATGQPRPSGLPLTMEHVSR